ncbi:hypothetical protein [Rubripirellula lacrimiformis]|uniref:hypothetical protein n=1 Tax=Rubripirellula lacrimiformis TaxID=1930273 RepID=UPI0011A84B43|nr:hypothetical protein [Rubripirellula lacrimiformis]
MLADERSTTFVTEVANAPALGNLNPQPKRRENRSDDFARIILLVGDEAEAYFGKVFSKDS